MKKFIIIFVSITYFNFINNNEIIAAQSLIEDDIPIPNNPYVVVEDKIVIDSEISFVQTTKEELIGDINDNVPKNPYPINPNEYERIIKKWNETLVYNFDDFRMKNMLLDENTENNDPLLDLDL